MKLVCVIIVSFIFLANVKAQDQRALIIGVDTYAPPANAKISASAERKDWPTLDGCKNDADLIKAVIISRFGFTEKNVNEIVNMNATRNNILKGMEDLLSNSKKGDIAFIFYAGHGSQVKNSLSEEKDHKDESMVPVDTWQEGVSDIRDKELAIMFNRYIDKGVKLTVIFDCCHSGSIARGLFPSKNRFIAESNYDAKDASNPIPPESRKNTSYLIMSASQDNELASEQVDDLDSSHGAFTLALVKAIDQQSVKSSSQNLFSSLRAILKSNGKAQEPVLAGDPDRFNQTLFGIEKSKLSDRTLFSVLKVEEDKSIVIQGGLAAGINIDNELSSVDGSIKLKVTSLSGINQSTATIILGSADQVKPGVLFWVSNWVSSTGPLLNIYVPDGDYSYDAVKQMMEVDKQLKGSGQVKWMNSFDKAEPDITIVAANNKIKAIEYAKGLAGITELKEYTAASVMKLANNKNLFVNLPPAQDLVRDLQKKFSEFRTIRLVKNPSEANYILYGTLDEKNNLAYGFMKADIALRDSLASMPLYTKYFPLMDNTDEVRRQVVDSLFDIALKLSKVRGWLTLSAPTNAGYFPYHLTMRNKSTGKLISDAGAKINDPLSLSIDADDDYLSKDIDVKFIYAFTIDIKGKMQLLYPKESDGNNQNKFPSFTDGVPAKSKVLFDEMEAYYPVGTDNYFLIASKEPLTGYNTIFNQEGVRGVPPTNNPLSNLLNMGNQPMSRGPKLTTPANWNLLRLAVKTIQ